MSFGWFKRKLEKRLIDLFDRIFTFVIDAVRIVGIGKCYTHFGMFFCITNSCKRTIFSRHLLVR